MARGDTAAALVTSLYGLDLAPTAMKLVPRPLLKALTNQAMRSEDKKATNDTVTMRKVAPTLRYEGLLLAEMAGTVGSFANVDADVLLIGGSMKRPAFIRPAFEALVQTLPHNRCVRDPRPRAWGVQRRRPGQPRWPARTRRSGYPLLLRRP